MLSFVRRDLPAECCISTFGLRKLRERYERPMTDTGLERNVNLFRSRLN